ncbi:ribosome 60S biogenesis N-terminal-domain-containing protein [Apiosordaria backusii]|uniref:Ribosome 60S biogenesis N-terminal-domain-containing protein n=1 Tax=Apiosordaria backusii TaxID=314023 RepID=A0AA40ED85_9PEZI|nr:ribosome 60S biogenesis N-terminal-domain-containing protein [Apiosordaria backusii]
MGKRFSYGGDAAGAPRKRAKVVHEAPTSEEVHASRQLRQLLIFDQDPARSRHGLQSFKLFLDELLSADGGIKSERARILRDYLDAEKPAEDDESPVYLPDIMQTWSHAGQTNNDNIMSAVPVVLVLLLRLLSQSLDTVPYGLGICRTLLQKRQQELISRNLAADKGKSFIISPTLRLLREAVSFDGGAIARPLFRARATMLKSLARNMGIVHMGEDKEDTKRPSARTNAIQFFLSAIKYLHPEAKKELLSQRDIVSALTRDVKQDPPYLLKELLTGLKTHIIMDDKVPREAKSNLLNTSTLVRLSALYQYRLDSPAEDEPSIADLAHELLLTVCTNPACGVLRQDSGFYPRELDPNTTIPTAELDDLGLEAVVWMNKFKNDVPVRNFTLSNFLPNLRPWSSVKQSELITSIFRVAPELVANYFLSNKSFTFEPKLSATWIGYAAFLFNTVILPIPENLCRGPSVPELPPPTSIVLDNILPLPLNQKALVRCLEHKSNMIKFFATRIMVVAIEKLDAVIRIYQGTSRSNQTIWNEAARRLVDEFCQRSPGIRNMINACQKIPTQDLLHREAASRLLRLCYEVLPQATLSAKLDVSIHLDAALGRISNQELDDPRDFALGLKELESLLAIAGYSPGMRWFGASKGTTLSPFTQLLKVCAEAPKGVSLKTIQQVLNFVAAEQQLVPGHAGHPRLLPLVEALQTLHQSSPKYASQVWPFLDTCFTHCASKSVKYVEMLQEIAQETAESTGQNIDEALVSPIILAIRDQLPHASKNGGEEVLKGLGRLLPTLLGLSVTVGESRAILSSIFSKMVSDLPDPKGKLVKAGVPEGLQFQHNSWSPTKTKASRPEKNAANSHDAVTSETAIDRETLEGMLHIPDSLEAENSALMKWANKTADELVDEGYATSLIALLASEHASIRKEALVSILKVADKIKPSEYEEKEQVWLLLSELAETAKGNIDDGPLPSTIVAFASHALHIVRDPLHGLYPKVNIFLTRGPYWSLDKLPLVDEILTEEPNVGDAFYTQISWLLTYLIDGLRTAQDLELYHKKRAKGPILERILALAVNPYMRLPLRTQVLRLLYRASGIEGGSTTLTTRFSVMNWLEERRSACADPSEAAVYESLRKRIWETCDQQRVVEWSKEGLP